MSKPDEILRAKVEYANKYLLEHIGYVNHDHKGFYTSFAALELERPGALTDVSMACFTATGRHILEQDSSAWTPDFFESLATSMKDFADGPQTAAYLLHWRFRHPTKTGEEISAYYAGSSKQVFRRVDIHNTCCREGHNESHVYARVRESATQRLPTPIKMAEVKALESEDSLIEHLEHLIVVIMDLAHTCTFKETTNGIKASQIDVGGVKHDAFEGSNRQDPIRQSLPKADNKSEECRHCSVLFPRMLYIDHLRHDHNDHRGMHACTQCKTDPATPSGLEKHLLWHYPNEDRPFPCSKCPQKFVSQGHRDQHYCTHHATEEERVFKCPNKDCSASFFYEPKYTDHVKRSHKELVLCPVEFCGAMIKPRSVEEHIRLKHPAPDAPKFICTFDGCDKDLKSEAALRSHVAKCPIGIGKTKCDHCTKSFSKNGMKGHLSSYHALCPVCNTRVTVTMFKVAERERQLMAHIKCCSTNIDGSKRVRDVDSDGEKENKRPARV
ncbi:hypothetical protein B0A48_01871 [Cryoendolithus antarcticus]|uniref:C2H2-type domain-containing protein n=1 Tax=Cryoendolithus antarcticus TaxID=1507870 RepID=A0A1V8TQY8_9PEZI|nr:hypothetical protein B0A48_01871 [Cryoendolithus antarcticus]